MPTIYSQAVLYWVSLCKFNCIIWKEMCNRKPTRKQWRGMNLSSTLSFLTMLHPQSWKSTVLLACAFSCLCSLPIHIALFTTKWFPLPGCNVLNAYTCPSFLYSDGFLCDCTHACSCFRPCLNSPYPNFRQSNPFCNPERFKGILNFNGAKLGHELQRRKISTDNWNSWLILYTFLC